MLKSNKVRACPRCEGELDERTDPGERLRCLQCGWREYADRLPDANGHGSFEFSLPYMGGRRDDKNHKKVVAEILDGERVVSLRVLCPFCAPVARYMECRNARLQRWFCEKGHAIHLKVKGREFVGWL